MSIQFSCRVVGNNVFVKSLIEDANLDVHITVGNKSSTKRLRPNEEAEVAVIETKDGISARGLEHCPFVKNGTNADLRVRVSLYNSTEVAIVPLRANEEKQFATFATSRSEFPQPSERRSPR